MTTTINLILTPRTLEEKISIQHTNELVTLDKEPYNGNLPLKNYGVNKKFIENLTTIIPTPRSNTYVLNLINFNITNKQIRLQTNYSNMRSQFALRRWIPELNKDSPERKLILQHVIPISGIMIIESIDGNILIEERSQVEFPGKYLPAPAGGCETRNWKVFPNPFRSIKGEAWEEIGLLPEDYSPLGLIGLARNLFDNASLIYHTTANIPLAEMISKADSIAPEAGEHQRLFGIKTDASSMLDFCKENAQKMVGNGLGGIIAFGGYKFGNLWVQKAIAELEKQNLNIIKYNTSFP